MKVVLAGGTGYLGGVLASHFLAKGAEVVVLSRQAPKSGTGIRYVNWLGADAGWEQEVNGAAVVINLAGKSVNCRYTAKNRRLIVESRTLPTHALAAAILRAHQPPKVWVNAASAAIYGDTGTARVTEDGPLGQGFSPDVCRAWEGAFFKEALPSTRRICLRIAIVLGQNADVLKPFWRLAALGLAGTFGRGTQGWSWLHEADFCRALDFLLTQEEEGVFNLSSPEPVSNRQWMQSVRNAAGVPIGLPAPAPLIRLGTWVLGTAAELVLQGRYVLPGRLQSLGFTFEHTAVEAALQASRKP